jgi:aspartate kinase
LKITTYILMKKAIVFKFGGASIKDAKSLINLSDLLYNRLQKNSILVVSAMGKTTNALEEILNLKIANKIYSSNFTILKEKHCSVCEELFPPHSPIFSIIENLFTELHLVLEKDFTPSDYDEIYDRVISFGELLSSRIVHEYLCLKGLICIWKDARDFIVTNDDFRAAKVDWNQTKIECHKHLSSQNLDYPKITQGFIGKSTSGKTTTLGREGSDFTAAIIASSLEASSVTIWKDVDGVLNADPKRFSDTIKFDEIDYTEAAELTYYGASVIHPKTIKPLANKNIPLFVKSFLVPDAPGTKIHKTNQPIDIPCFVIKENQVLMSLKIPDFTFINASHLSLAFMTLEKLKLNVNLIQQSAISLTLIFDEQLYKTQQLIDLLSENFMIRYNTSLTLLTVKNHHLINLKSIKKNHEILLEQTTRSTYQMVYKTN